MDTNGSNSEITINKIVRIIFILILLLFTLYWIFNDYNTVNSATGESNQVNTEVVDSMIFYEEEDNKKKVYLPESVFVLYADNDIQFQIDKVTYELKDQEKIHLKIIKNNEKGIKELIKELRFGQGIPCPQKKNIIITLTDSKDLLLLKCKHPVSKNEYFIYLRIKELNSEDNYYNYEFVIQNFFINKINNKANEEANDVIRIFLKYFKCVIDKMNT